MPETSLTVESLSAAWYEHRAYKPRVETEEGSLWFPLARRDWLTTDLANLNSSGEASGGLDDALAATYRDWNLPHVDAADENLLALGSGRATCVVTGQQPGFLGGPLFTLYKAVSAIAAARRLSEIQGTPCVPVFWVASEDHDIEEVRRVRFPGSSPNNEVQFELPHEFDRRPLSTLPIDGIAEVPIEAATEHFRKRRFGELASELVSLYRTRSVASGFAALLASLLGRHGLVVVDPEKLRPLGAELVRRVIEDPSSALERVEEGVRTVESTGMPAFVRARLPLFLVRDGRRDHLSPSPSGELVVDGGGPEIPRAELLSILEREPERFSTGALLRPLVQELVLPSTLTIGGAAEVGYFAQLGPLADWLGVRRPPIALRLQATCVEGKIAKQWKKLSLDLESFSNARRPADWFLGSEEESATRQTLRDDVGRLRTDLARLREVLLAHHPEFEKNIARGADSVETSLSRFEAKVGDLIERASSDRVGSSEAIWSAVFPGDRLQERRHGFLHLIARHGTSWIDQLIEQVTRSPLDVHHRLLWFGES